MKGFKMLPFIAGIAAGCLAVYAYNNKGKIKDVAKDGIKKGKETLGDVKDFAVKNIEKIGDKKVDKTTKKPAKTTAAKKTSTAKKTGNETKSKTTRKRKINLPIEVEEKTI